MASSKQVLVNSTAQIIVEAYGENRRVVLHNSNDHPCYIGGSDVTSSNGMQFPKDSNLDFLVPIGSVLYAATAGANTTTVSVLYLEP
jgi:hypothetical protein